MALHDDLLWQARHLATMDRRRPRQVNLRASISRAYYAVFHLLTTTGTRTFVRDRETQRRIARTYNHADLLRTASALLGGRLPRSIQPESEYSPPEELLRIARSFIELQDARHDADYVQFRVFVRQEAVGFVIQAEDVFRDWREIRRTDDARLFLANFLLWRRWDGEPR